MCFHAAAGPGWLIAPAALSITSPEQHHAIDALESEMRQMPAVEAPVDHVFTPGLYTRVIDMPAGMFLTSKIHKTEHVFVVLSGKAAVWDGESGVQIIRAPHMGITKPGTRRVLLIGEQCRWATFHPSNGETVEEIEARIIEPRNCIENSGNLLQIEDTQIPIQKLLQDALDNDKGI